MLALPSAPRPRASRQNVAVLGGRCRAQTLRGAARPRFEPGAPSRPRGARAASRTRSCGRFPDRPREKHVHCTSPARRNRLSYSSTAFGGRVADRFSIHSYLTSPASSAVMHFAASGDVRPASDRSRRDVRWCLDNVGWQRHRVSQPRRGRGLLDGAAEVPGHLCADQPVSRVVREPHRHAVEQI